MKHQTQIIPNETLAKSLQRGKYEMRESNHSNEMENYSYIQNQRSSLNDYKGIGKQDNFTSAYNTNDSKTNMLSGMILTQASLERLSLMKEPKQQQSPVKEKPCQEYWLNEKSHNNETEIIDNLKQNQYLIKSNFQNNAGTKKKSRRQDGEISLINKSVNKQQQNKMSSDYMNSTTYSNHYNEDQSLKMQECKK